MLGALVWDSAGHDMVSRMPVLAPTPRRFGALDIENLVHRMSSEQLLLKSFQREELEHGNRNVTSKPNDKHDLLLRQITMI